MDGMGVQGCGGKGAKKTKPRKKKKMMMMRGLGDKE